MSGQALKSDSKDGVHMSRLLIFLIIISSSFSCSQPPSPNAPVLGSGVATISNIETVPVPPPDSPSALSQTAAAYAESMKVQIDKHSVKPVDNSPKSVEILMSNVKWLEPDFSLRIAPPQRADAPEKISANVAAIAPDVVRSTPPSFREN